MAAYFFDTSALVKRYATETGTAWVTSLIDPASNNRIYVARIAGVETVSALTRKRRGNHITAADAAKALAALRGELGVILRVVEMTDAMFDQAMLLAEKHALRGYDAVQLASAIYANNRRTSLNLSPLTFISADVDLNASGAAEGLSTDDPNKH